MKRFVFKLDGVLQLRNRHERKEIDKHAQALRVVNELAETLDTLRAGLLLEQQRYQESLSQPQSVAMMQNLRAGCEYYEHRVFETRQQLAIAEKELDQCQKNLTSARSEREIMEKYRNRLAGVHAQSIDQADQVFLDELSLRSANQYS